MSYVLSSGAYVAIQLALNASFSTYPIAPFHSQNLHSACESQCYTSHQTLKKLSLVPQSTYSFTATCHLGCILTCLSSSNVRLPKLTWSTGRPSGL